MAYPEYFNAQTRLQTILANCQNWNQEQLDAAMTGLVDSTMQMVRVRREAMRPMQPAVVVTSNSSISDSDSSWSDSESDSDDVVRVAEVARAVPNQIGGLTLSRPAVLSRPVFRPSTPPSTPPPLREPQAARIMPNQTGGLTLLRPSVLLQQMRASSTVTATQISPSVLLELMHTSSEVRAALESPLVRISWYRYFNIYMKKRAIGAAKFNANCPTPCAICLDTHTTGESVVTEECNHCFGKQCWQTWMSHPTGNQCCPTCRTPCPKTIFYSQRAERKPKQDKK